MLYDFIKERMMCFPNQCLSDSSRSITFPEVVSFVEDFSSQLKCAKIGILCDWELNTGLGLLACFKAGVTAVPLSYRYGKVHVDKIIQAMSLSYVISDDGGMLHIKQLHPIVAECEDLSDVVLIMCTSGTTGQAKGAMLTHENLVTNIRDIDRYFSIDHQDTILIARPLYHSGVLTGEFLISLCKGLNIRFHDGAFDPVRLIWEIARQDITVFGGTPTLLYHMCRMASRSKDRVLLRVVVSSGECMTRQAADLMIATMPDTSMYHAYGLSEAGPRVSVLLPEEFSCHPLSVGYPLESVEVRIENGELLVRGNNVMKGYYNDQVLTEKILDEEGGLYTGDSAVLDDKGRITIKGRLDHMIIRAGVNINPQEIENVLKADSRVEDVLAYGQLCGTTQRLCAQIVTDDLDKNQLMTICREKLPEYAIPDVLQLVDSIPRNASGKVIRPRFRSLS